MSRLPAWAIAARKRQPSKAHRAPKKPPSPFDAAASMAFALDALSRPPRPGIERREPVGHLVARFILPLDLCPGVNRLAEMPPFARAKVKDACLAVMLRQCGLRKQAAPLPGRPFVRVIRFSSHEPDNDASYSKVPVDRLTVGKRKRPAHIDAAAWASACARVGPVGLGYLRDDRPADAEIRSWWEPDPPGKGCVLVEVWSGDPR